MYRILVLPRYWCVLNLVGNTMFYRRKKPENNQGARVMITESTNEPLKSKFKEGNSSSARVDQLEKLVYQDQKHFSAKRIYICYIDYMYGFLRRPL